MKKILTILFLLLLSSPVFAGRVNTSGGNSAGGGTSQATASLNVTTGNLIVVTSEWVGSAGTVTGVTDTALNTYTQCVGCYATSGNVAEDIWYAKNITGNASNVVTVTYSTSVTFTGATQIQYSGTSTSSPFETGTTATNANGTTVTSPSFSPASSGNINVAVSIGNGGTTWTPDSNYSTVDSTNTFTQDRVSAPSGSQTVTATSSNVLTLVLGVASFKVSGGGGGGGSPIITVIN